MKRVLIAVMTLLLLAGCKTRIYRELDNLGKEVDNALAQEELELTIQRLNELFQVEGQSFSDKERALYHQILEKEEIIQQRAMGYDLAKHYLRAYAWFNEMKREEKISTVYNKDIRLSFTLSVDLLVEQMKKSGEFGNWSEPEMTAFAVTQFGQLPEFSKEYETVVAGTAGEYKKYYELMAEDRKSFENFQTVFEGKLQKPDEFTTALIARYAQTTRQEILKLDRKIRKGMASEKDSTRFREIRIRCAEAIIGELYPDLKGSVRQEEIGQTIASLERYGIDVGAFSRQAIGEPY